MVEIPLCEFRGAVAADGAIMELLSHDSWSFHEPKFQVPAGYTNPKLGDVLLNTAIENWADTVSRLEFGCHDAWVLRPEDGGGLLFVRRTEPGNRPDGLHTAPINDFLWPIGGRIRLFPADHELSGGFGLYQSLLFKIEQEVGILPEMIEGIYSLGISRLWFDQRMTYYYSGPAESDQFVREIQMVGPVRTISSNFVIVLKPGAGEQLNSKDNSVADPVWISETESWKPGIRNSLCSYVQHVSECVLLGWKLRTQRK